MTVRSQCGRRKCFPRCCFTHRLLAAGNDPDRRTSLGGKQMRNIALLLGTALLVCGPLAVSHSSDAYAAPKAKAKPAAAQQAPAASVGGPPSQPIFQVWSDFLRGQTDARAPSTGKS